jgi:arylsulfatase A-like enzyme
MRSKRVDPERYIKQAIDRYDAEIAHNDRSIELLIGKLKETGMLDDTVVVIASDHGEEFWEHGFGAHGHSLYSELIRAALLIWNPRRAPARRIREPVQLIDIMPTLLELADARIPEGLQGQSLTPLLKGRPFTRRETVMSSKLALPQARPGGGVAENLTDSFARIERGWKMIYRPQADRARLKEVELFDRASDAGDRADVSAQRRDVAERMRSEAIQWLVAQKQLRMQLGPGGKSTIDTQTLERLRSLGYVGGRK